MGGFISRYWTGNELPTDGSSFADGGSVVQFGRSLDSRITRKRDARICQIDSGDDAAYLHTPKKKKLKSTTEYIYQVLFIGGENSDVTIKALGREWKLHKLYLRQCRFFESMFGRSWKETEASTITLDIPDTNIDADALTIAFGCLYRDDFTIEPVHVVPVLASASLLQLDGLMHQCSAIMKETISSKTVCDYYECSVMYGLKALEEACFRWLESNIMCKQSRNLLRHISVSLMKALVKSPNLFVMQVEMDVYNLLKRWLFLQLMPSWNGSFKSGLTKQAENHFRELIKQEFGQDSNKTVLETRQGAKYWTVFADLRLQHIMVDLASILHIKNDRIIPQEWLFPFYESNWLTLLSMENTADCGPNSDEVDVGFFLKYSLRCARILTKEAEYQWRWIGFNFGIDLVVIYSNRLLIFKRNCNNQTRLLSNQTQKRILFKVTVTCCNDLGQIVYSKTSGIKSHNFNKDEEFLCLSIDKKAPNPLRISLNVLYYTPKADIHSSPVLNAPHEDNNKETNLSVSCVTEGSKSTSHNLDQQTLEFIPENTSAN